MSNIKTWEHKDILNQLAEMQQKPYYAVCRHILAQAELAICTLEQKRDALRAELDDWRFTNKIDELQRSHDALQAKITAAHAQGEIVVTKTPDGQIVAVTRQDEEGQILKVIAESAGAAPVTMSQARAEELAHRRCKRYIFIDDVPYQFDAHTLMDFVRDVEKAGAAPAPEGWQLVPAKATPEMSDAADRAWNTDMSIRTFADIYKAMLAAAGKKK